MKEVFCFIPAKSKSKRLKNKNIKILGGQPMMNYAIKSAIDSELFSDEIFVSTDNNDYALIAKKAGAKILQLRPIELAFDPFGIKDVLIDFLNSNQSMLDFKDVIIISPTCPLLSPNDLINAYKIFKKEKAKTLISITKNDYSALRSVTIKKNRMMPLFQDKINMKSQDLEPTYRINGAIIILNIQSFKGRLDFFAQEVYCYEMPRERSVDVDTIEDFNYAEYLLKQ